MNHIIDIDLEKKLEGNAAFFNIYSRIKEKSALIWNEPLLPDFTDHSTDHSERIIKIMERLLGFWGDGFNLNDAEILVLLSSAWLHDIGMQGMKQAEGKADMLREMHAKFSHDIILKDGFEEDSVFLKRLTCGFREPDGGIKDYNILTCVALVSKGHSGNYFQEVADLFNNEPRFIQEMEVDGEFLTALLMVADELDLKDRENLAPNQHYSALSLLHQKKHQRINHIDYEFDENENQVILKIQFEFLQNDTDELKEKLKKWVLDKLSHQFSRTRNIFHRRTRFSICPRVFEMPELTAPAEAQYPTPFKSGERDFLFQEIDRMDIYNREKEREHLSQLLKDDGPCGIFYYYNVGSYDMEKLFGWFEKAACVRPGVWFSTLSFDMASSYSFTLDSLALETAGVVNSNVRLQKEETGESRASSGKDRLQKAFSELNVPGKIVLLVEDMAALGAELQEKYVDLLANAIALRHSGTAAVLLLTSQKQVLGKVPDNVSKIKMAPFTEELIREILKTKTIPPGHDLEKLAEKLYNQSSGRPEKVSEYIEILTQ